MATYAEPGADIIGQDATVHFSLTLPYNRSTWLKKAKPIWKERKSHVQLSILKQKTGMHPYIPLYISPPHPHFPPNDVAE